MPVFQTRPTAAGEVSNEIGTQSFYARFPNAPTAAGEVSNEIGTQSFYARFPNAPTAAGEVSNLASLECLSNCRFYHSYVEWKKEYVRF